MTLEALQRAKNDRLWFKANLKLCNLWFKLKEFGRMARIVKELKRSCQREDGSDDPKKGTQLVEARGRRGLDLICGVWIVRACAVLQHALHCAVLCSAGLAPAWLVYAHSGCSQ